jgi:predicted RNase H-like nuclease (RuvC/YqgF family)
MTGLLSLRRAILTGIAIGGLGGCTIAELQRQEKAEAESVQQKQAAVQAEQARSETLGRQQEQLKADLAKRQLSLDELNTRVAQLQAANARDSAANDEVRRHREQLIGKIHGTGTQLVALQQAPDNGSAQKQAQINFLKQQIQDQLDLLLH